jgi:hypothetical protein
MITVSLHCNDFRNIAEMNWTRFSLESMTKLENRKIEVGRIIYVLF